MISLGQHFIALLFYCSYVEERFLLGKPDLIKRKQQQSFHFDWLHTVRQWMLKFYFIEKRKSYSDNRQLQSEFKIYTDRSCLSILAFRVTHKPMRNLCASPVRMKCWKMRSWGRSMTYMGRKVSARTTTVGASMRVGSGTSRTLVGLRELLGLLGPQIS